MKSPALLLALVATTLSGYAAESSATPAKKETSATASITPYVVVASPKAPDLKPLELDLKKELATNASMKPALDLGLGAPVLPTLGNKPAAAADAMKLADVKPAQLQPGQKPATPGALTAVAEIETKKSEQHPK